MRHGASNKRLVATVSRAILSDPEMAAVSRELLERRDDRPIYLDLSRVQYVSSGALRELIKLHVRIHEAGGRLVLCNLVRPILELIEIVHLDRFVEFAEVNLDTEGEEPGPGGTGVNLPRRPQKPSDEGSAFLVYHADDEDDS